MCVPPLNGALFTRPRVAPLQKAEGGGAAEALHERPGEAERGKRQGEGKKGKDERQRGAGGVTGR